MRNTYALIYLEYLKENINEIMNKYKDYKYYIGVVKANAYGHGNKVIKTMEFAGINYFAVSSLEEAIEVRKQTKLPILCFGYVSLDDLDLVVENNITLSIISYEYYDELKKSNKKIKVHLKLNTGMNRFGINDKYLVKEIVDHIGETKLILEGIYTHLATSGVRDKYYDLQISKWKELTSLIDLSKIEIVHLFNSLALARHDKLKEANGVRLGLMMYGFTYSTGYLNIINKCINKLKHISNTHLRNDLKLKKVLSLYSEVINIVDVYPKEFVGYGAKFIAKDNSKIAVVSIGHADGVRNNYKYVVINNKKYKIISICMDYILVLIDEDVKLHDIVTLIGNGITVGDLSKNTSPHNVLVSISDRVERKYEG